MVRRKMDPVDVDLTEPALVQVHQLVGRAARPIRAVLGLKGFDGQPPSACRPVIRWRLLQPHRDRLRCFTQELYVAFRPNIEALGHIGLVDSVLIAWAEPHPIKRVELVELVNARQAKNILVIEGHYPYSWVVPWCCSPRLCRADYRRFLDAIHSALRVIYSIDATAGLLSVRYAFLGSR